LSSCTIGSFSIIVQLHDDDNDDVDVRYGFLSLGEEHRLMVLENMVLRRIFGPKRDEVTQT
jgi:hypothetical protein